MCMLMGWEGDGLNHLWGRGTLQLSPEAHQRYLVSDDLRKALHTSSPPIHIQGSSLHWGQLRTMELSLPFTWKGLGQINIFSLKMTAGLHFLDCHVSCSWVQISLLPLNHYEILCESFLST